MKKDSIAKAAGDTDQPGKLETPHAAANAWQGRKRARKLKAAGAAAFLLVFSLLMLEFWSTFTAHKAEAMFFIGGALIALVLASGKNWVAGAVMLALAVVWVLAVEPLSDVLAPMGIDPLAENVNFDWSEARLYLLTVKDSIRSGFPAIRVALYAAATAALYLLLRQAAASLRLTGRLFVHVQVLLALLMMSLGTKAAYQELFSSFSSASSRYLAVAGNFNNEPPQIAFDGPAVKMVIYIGESTSTMNMEVYGYPRATTPHLKTLAQEDPKALFFNKVFATHTHTTPSLLEALSLGVVAAEDVLPIDQRRRVSIVDVLSKAAVKSYLISNRDRAGSWNHAASIVFKNAAMTFGTTDPLLGNADDAHLRKPDHLLFASHLPAALDRIPPSERAVIFLHSYAGHGVYAANVPADFAHPVDAGFASMDPRALLGPKAHASAVLEDYDSAVKYVDFAVARSIQTIKSRPEPIVFIYFSDHGEAAFANRGHDSSRFIHEMARVPFLIYVNDAARIARPDLLEKYRHLARQRSVSTLAQLPATIVDLLGGRPLAPESGFPDVIGSANRAPIKPIVVRKTTQGTTYVNLNTPSAVPKHASASLRDKTDDVTAIFAAAHHNRAADTKVCYHRSNTVAAALRASLVADCLELDLVVEKDGSLSVYHPPTASVNLQLGKILEIAYAKKMAVWLDSKNLDDPRNCAILADYLEKSGAAGKQLLVEFPSVTPLGNPELLECSAKLRSFGFRTSFYVPNEEAAACSDALARAHPVSSKDCSQLNTRLERAVESGLFTDFSFDYAGVMAMETLAVGHKLRWNTWHVAANSFDHIRPERFGIVILNAKDPNKR